MLEVAGIAGVTLSLMALLVQTALRTLRPMAAIQSALRSAAGGESAVGALAISPRWGPDAAGWNALIAEREALRRGLLERQGPIASIGVRGADTLAERACDAFPQGVLVLDSSLRIRYANGAAGVLLRRKRDSLPGRPVTELSLPDSVMDLLRAVAGAGPRRRGAVEVEQSEESERSFIRYAATRLGPDGSAAPSQPGGAPATAGALVVIEDLTQQRVADQARDSFVTHATHELRTPLTNIRLYVEMLQEDGESDPATRGKCINVINQETRRLERMVSDMLSVAEIEAGSMKLNADDVRLDALFDELAADYLPQAAEKEIKLNFDLSPKLPVIRGDRDKVMMTLHNLVGNALKYTPSGGTVTVKVDAGESSVVVRVQDTGIGIAPDEAQRIFEKFYRSKDKRVAKITGTGLGLALAREVARLHGGDVTVESQLDRGSTFTLTLPVAPLARAA
jgi:signal transduction histidine kinase